MQNKKEAFRFETTVLDTETTNCIPIEAEIVELAGAHFIDNNWIPKSKLYGTPNGIPCEASAKNNISNKMIAGLGTFADNASDAEIILGMPHKKWYVAHNSDYDQMVLAVGFNSAGRHDLSEIASDKSRWICTMRLAKHLFSNLEGMSFNLGYLRYKLELGIPEDTKNHRASDDTVVCAALLEFLVEYAESTGAINSNLDIGEQLNKLCWKPIITKTFPFGKYKGQYLSKIPTDYWLWALKNMDILNEKSHDYDRDLAESVRLELEKRVS
jgi:DNA polymerase III epsilon subunit-like protein